MVQQNKHLVYPIFSDDDSWDLVTCFCMKPFAGRAMIECNKCNTWIHLSCAKIRKSHVPETYVCQSCRETDGPADARRSHRSRVGSRKHLLDWPHVELWTLTPSGPRSPSTCWTNPSSNSGPTPFGLCPSWSVVNPYFLWTLWWTYPEPLSHLKTVWVLF